MSIASARRVVGWILDDRRHYVDVTEDSWVLMHPLSCRMGEGSLLACAITEMVGRGWRPSAGRYLVEPAEGLVTELKWTGVKKDFDPIVSRLLLIIDHLDHAEESQ